MPPRGFDRWWRDPLVEASNQKRFSRENLVLIMANQGGGAHVDAGVDANYSDLVVDFLGAEIVTDAGNEIDIDGVGPFGSGRAQGNVAAASVRQIAYEVLQTLKDAGIPCPPFEDTQPCVFQIGLSGIKIVGTPDL